MSDHTGISWTDATWNPVRGCSRVSEGCRNCYAERMAARFSGPGMPYHGLAQVIAPRDHLDRTGGRRNGWTRVVRMVPERLADPLRWKRPRRIFVNSMSDLFHERLTNEEIAAVFGIMAAAPQHTFQILTKRARRMREWFEWVTSQKIVHQLITPQTVCYQWAHTKLAERTTCDEIQRRRMSVTPAEAKQWPLANVWIGVSVENQAAADERIPELLQTPAAVRFLSCEPLIGPVRLHEWTCRESGLKLIGAPRGLSWVIAGCESGPGARACDVAWLRSLRDQCEAADVAYFLKQAVGTPGELAEGCVATWVVGADCGSKIKAAGVIELPYLDGVQHAEFPVTP